MRRMKRKGWGAVLALVMGAWLTPMAVGAQAPPRDGAGGGMSSQGQMPADIAAAQHFLFAAYPDLIGRSLELTLRRDGDAVLVSVVDPNAVVSAPVDPGRAVPAPPSPPEGASPTDDGAVAVPIVTVRIEFDADLRLRRYDAYGPLVHEAENLALQEQLVANPRWVDSDADAWLTTRGAASTFAPASAAVATPSIAVAERLGVQSAPTSARFEWHAGGTTANGARVFRSRPAWMTEATGAGADGRALVYQFEYEPFGGRLIAVTLQEAR